ncbi:endonuclease domain-containing protein [Microbacterium testaceum]|uniref:endonuclease domain-containing protein n=1 Tax=Microbacterium testaceum TaxID=2033 RepID=UPI0007349390|nr:DUF559 domain-containing protein [Microbacterium testaceum]
MRRPRPLPVNLGAAFHVKDADELEVPRRRLIARDLNAPFHGVRASADAPQDSVLERCRTYLPRLRPGQFFSHATAARLWGMPLAFRHDETLHVSAVPPAREPRTKGVVGHRLALPLDEITTLDGLPVTAKVATWTHLAAVVSEADLVAIADWLLAHDVPPSALSAAAGKHRHRGIIALRSAAHLARPGSESPRESHVRLILVRAGLPEPDLNWTLRDPSGAFVARLDMAYPDHRVAVEYDGRQHADAQQFRKDADRWRAIAARGWTLIRVVAHHLEYPERDVVAPVTAALRTAGWRP